MIASLPYRLAAFFAALAIVASICIASVVPASAASTTGTIQGTVTDPLTKAPLGGVTVNAASPSGSGKAVTNDQGFYSIPNLSPDTYVVTFSKSGYDTQQSTGVTVFQDQAYTLDQPLAKRLREIARTTTRAASNLVQPGQTADVYNLSAQQLDAAQGGDNVHKTLYNYLQSVPGITGSGAYAQPRVRGGLATDVAYELDGIPINDRLTGFFTTNLANVGVGSVEVYTGGYNAKYGLAGQGVFNSVIKRGTYPSQGLISMASTFPTYGHFLTFEYGNATPDNKFSYYVAFDGTNTQNQFAHGAYSFPLFPIFGINGPGPVDTRDIIGNFHYKPTARDDVQFMIQNGYGRFNFNYLMTGANVVAVTTCAGFQAANFVATVGGTSITGKPCVDTSGSLTNAAGVASSPTNPVPTGLQFVSVDPNFANVWYHYSGLGKLQWNHVFNDKLYGSFRLAENFNQYIFDQPYDDPNFANTIKPGDVAIGQGNDNGADDFIGDRRSHIYLGNVELNLVPNSRSTYYGGVTYERDQNNQAYSDKEGANAFMPAFGGSSAFDKNGNFPNTYLLVNYPLTLPSAYFGTTQKFGKLTLEPSFRYDQQNYQIPASKGGTYSVSGVSPRFGFAYSPRNDTVWRGSYNVTTTFVPAAYVFNNSVDGTDATGSNRTPYAPGADIKPSMDHNVDFSFEKQLNEQTSLKISPYYHHSTNKLSFVRNVVVDPATGALKTTGLNLPKNAGETKDLGVEFGLNHVVRGNGLSWFLSGTYQNYWSSSQNLLSPFGGFTNILDYVKNRTLYRNPSNPPISAALTMDYNRDRFHLQPYVLYQCCSYYNVLGSTSFTDRDANGNVIIDPATGKPKKVIDTQVHTAPAYFFGNVTVSYDLARASDKSRTTLGFRVQNITDNLKADVAPLVNSKYKPQVPGAPVTVGGIYQFPAGALPNTLYVNPPISQTPRSYELFLTSRF